MKPNHSATSLPLCVFRFSLADACVLSNLHILREVAKFCFQTQKRSTAPIKTKDSARTMSGGFFREMHLANPRKTFEEVLRNLNNGETPIHLLRHVSRQPASFLAGDASSARCCRPRRPEHPSLASGAGPDCGGWSSPSKMFVQKGGMAHPQTLSPFCYSSYFVRLGRRWDADTFRTQI